MFYKLKNCLLLVVLLCEVTFIVGIHMKIEMLCNLDKKNHYKVIELNRIITKELEYFPIGREYIDMVHFEDTYNATRENGAHEGCDILYIDNCPGIVPILSATDGIITNLGWLYLGGYRIGITSESGMYYYYAHLDSYSPRLYVGKSVTAGEFLGFMGDTGEGEEGTRGKFPVHLHFAIYQRDIHGNETPVNSYPFLIKINRE